MIEKIIKQLAVLGLVSAAGCTNTVKQEEFLAYKKNSEIEIRQLKDQISEAQQKASEESQKRDDLIIKTIEELNARLSVSSMDSYAIGLEEQTAQHARRYARLARGIANLHEKGWELGDTSTRELAKLQADAKTTENSLVENLADLRKLFDEAKKTHDIFKSQDYKIFKEETTVNQKNIEALETGLKNLARLIQQIEKNVDVSKVLETGTGPKTFQFAARVIYENPVTYALAIEQWRVELAYRKIIGEPIDESPLTRIYRFSTVSGEDEAIQRKELKNSDLEAKIDNLRKKDNKPYEELNVGNLIISDKTIDSASIKVAPADSQQEERLTALLEYKTPKQAAYVAGMISLHTKDGKITNEKLDYIMKKVQEKYGDKK